LICQLFVDVVVFAWISLSAARLAICHLISNMASALSKVLLIFALFWIGIYIFAYFWIMGPSTLQVPGIASKADPSPSSAKEITAIASTINTATSKIGTPRTLLATSSLKNPYLSQSCREKIIAFQSQSKSQINLSTAFTEKSVAVVMVVRNEEHPDDIISSISSIVMNSGGYLANIIVVDDLSFHAVDSWPEWLQLDASVREKVAILRPMTTLGNAGAKHFAVKSLTDRMEISHLLFMDAPAVVSDGWLVPLMDTLQKHPKAIAYPAIDVLTEDGFIESDNLVGAFDWALNFIWEPVNRDRLPLSSIQGSGRDTPLPSPATPGIFAMEKRFYDEIGGFDSALRLWGQDNVELSLRVWMCGGEIIKQPCSRAAQRYKNVFADAHAGLAVTQRIVDLNVMSIAERYMRSTPHGDDHKETVFQARFTGRIPYSVELSQNERYSKHMMHVNQLVSESCQSFDWFLQEIYPGLRQDRIPVMQAFQQHVASHATYDAAFGPLIQQYVKKHSDITVDQAELEKLDQRAHTADERSIQSLHDSFIPKKVIYKQPQDTLEEFDRIRIAAANRLPPPTPAPTYVPIPLGITVAVDAHEVHANRVRQELTCDDEEASGSIQSCESRLQEDKDACNKDKYYMWFGCPKSCGLCGVDGKICFDFYENKCLTWRDQGRCNEEIMTHVCRKACNLCTPAPPMLPVEKEEAAPILAMQNIVNADKVPDQPIVPAIQRLQPPGQMLVAVNSTQLYGQNDAGIDPFTAQKQFASGSLPDPGDNPADAVQNCALNGKSNGELLARVTLHDQASLLKANARPFKIFCGIYTYEKNHATNVQATKETWAKRCDGFIAMSTKLDPSIPSIAIEHEGPEEYDNMWQKSRMIWKYIAARFINDFDFFLLGGDDMFYIMENLRYYLGTDRNITTRFDEGKGLFIGRRFFPPHSHVFNSGGAGYILDRAALRVLGAHLDGPPCFPHQKGFWEDVNVANCLRETTGILPMDTRDELERERFHPFQPGNQLTYRPPQRGGKDWYVDYNPYLKLGFDCCSSDSISFHYAPAEDLRRLHRFLYHCHDKQATSNFGIVSK
jgi:hypothetical protein